MPIDLSKSPPATVEQAVDLLFSQLTREECAVLRKTQGGLTAKLFAPFGGHSFGLELIERWGLENDASLLHQDIKARFGLAGSDDCYALIASAVDAKIQHNEFFRLEDRAMALRSALREMGLDPAVRHKALMDQAQKLLTGGVKFTGGEDDGRLN